jgi:putative membrane protein
MRNSITVAAAVAMLLGSLATPVLAADKTQSADTSQAADAARASGSSPGSASVANVTPQQFAMQAAQGGMAEVQLSELARKQAGSAEVREFAERMIADHTKANTELMAIAKQKGMTLPKELSAEHRAAMQSLKSKKGAAFDEAYMAVMKKDHVKTIALLQAANGPTFEDAALKAFASKQLPIVEQHHDMVEKTEGQASQASR